MGFSLENYRKKTKLVNADINKVDFVPRGAQADAKISIFKSDNKNFMMDILEKAFSGFSLIPIEDSNPNSSSEDASYWENVVEMSNVFKSILDSDEEKKEELLQGAFDQFSADIITSFRDSAVAKGCGDKSKTKKMTPERKKMLEDCIKEISALMVEDDEDSDDQEQVCKDVNANKGGEANMEINKSELSPEVQAYITELENKVAKVAKTDPDPNPAPETPTETPTEPIVENIYKGLPESIVKAIRENETKLKEANAQIAKMTDESETKVFVAKAAELTANLGVNAEEFGPVLKSINAANPELATKVEAILKAANEAVKQGDLFVEMGKETHGSTSGVTKADAWTQIQALATARVTKGESQTEAMAVTEVLKTAEGRKLYAIYTGSIKG